jgi:hypothetical protein
MNILALLLLVTGTATAAPMHILIETPTESIVAVDCRQSSITIATHGTVFAADADCQHIARTPRTTRWRPTQHPDGAPIHYTGTVRIAHDDVVTGCAVVDYWSTAGYSMLVAECVP